jgi:hypothetical protein
MNGIVMDAALCLDDPNSTVSFPVPDVPVASFAEIVRAWAEAPTLAISEPATRAVLAKCRSTEYCSTEPKNPGEGAVVICVKFNQSGKSPGSAGETGKV